LAPTSQRGSFFAAQAKFSFLHSLDPEAACIFAEIRTIIAGVILAASS